jgi:hypothetical protein
MIINNQHFIHAADEAFHAITPEVHENTQRFISTFEDNIEKNKKKKEKKALENFIED